VTAVARQPAAAAAAGLGGGQDAFYARRRIVEPPLIVRGEGIYLHGDDGRRYIDVSSGAVVSNLGQGNERVLAAMAEQGRKLSFAYVRYVLHEPNLALSRRVAELAGRGFERVLLASGGSEANEMAIKFLRQHAYGTGQRSRTRVITCLPSYHGATLATLGWSGDTELEGPWGPMAEFSTKVPAPLTYRVPDGMTVEESALEAARALEREILRLGPGNVLAFMFEPVGGAATGATVPPDVYFREIRRICTHYGVYLVFDEVMAACRTGTFLAAHHWPDALPDVVVMAKGLGAGYTPLGAVLAPASMVDDVAELGGFYLSHTYNANPISCAAGLAVLDELVEQDLLDRAARVGAYLKARLEELRERSPIVGDVRGRGMLCAVELVADKRTKAMLPIELRAGEHVRRLGLRHGLIILARRTNEGRFGEWFLVAPPLITTEEQVDDMVGRLEATLADLAGELRAHGVIV
jgi:adenosylmethionine-8-amino-7-oxononanoate aminotransferase